jgi:hypothetical protein
MEGGEREIKIKSIKERREIIIKISMNNCRFVEKFLKSTK